ncbi:MAG: class II aldolase/adducin family protein [Actinomycetota bacterium]|nr:class II aldolase/adducin family protein [Actinomycetota bacterium]
MSLSEQRQAIVAAAELLTRAGVMSHTGHVNLSCRLDDERMLLTGVGLVHQITAETLAVVRLDGDVEEGRLEDSSRQIIGMHAAVYRSRAAATSVVHTHSPHVTAFALARTPLPSRYEALHRRGQTAPVPVVPWAPRGSTEANDGIAQTLHDHPHTWAVLLANHGLLACGSSPQDAARLVVVLEEAAAAELAAVALGGAKDLPPAHPTVPPRADPTARG